MVKKVFGWALLVAGVAIIIWTLVWGFNIFTAKTQAPVFFQTSQIQSQQQGQGAQAQMANLVQEQIQKMIPMDSINKILNLAIWSILAFILIFGGRQLSSIGTKLLSKEQ
jgi:hypothetical protein